MATGTVYDADGGEDVVIPAASQDGPPSERSLGIPIVMWSGSALSDRPRVPTLLFRPTRFTIGELWEEVERPRVTEPWRLCYALASRSECRLLQTILEDHGFAQTDGRGFNLLWLNCTVKPALLLTLNKYQKVNHFPRTHELTRKDLLTRTLGLTRDVHGREACDFLPMTFVLPADMEACTAAMNRERGQAAWIVKPCASSRGRGISIVQMAHQLPQDDVVVSRYIGNPLLIDGFKFDLRIYVAVTSFDPLRVYVFEEGLARFSTERYQPGVSVAALRNQFMHLTNYSVNKHSAHFVPNKDASADDYGNKWSLSALRRCLARNGVDCAALFARINSLIVKTLVAVEPSVVACCRRYCAHRSNCFELFGFDVLIDENLKPWLLEVNLSPSLGVDSPLDLKVKSRVLTDLFTLASIQPFDREAERVQKKRRDQMRCDRLSRGEPATKQVARQRTADGVALTPEAQRAVAEMDAEEAKCGGWQRIFPTASGHAYRHLFAQERAMNTLLVDVLRQRADARRTASAHDIDAFAEPRVPPAEAVGGASDGTDAQATAANGVGLQEAAEEAAVEGTLATGPSEQCSQTGASLRPAAGRSASPAPLMRPPPPLLAAPPPSPPPATRPHLVESAAAPAPEPSAAALPSTPPPKPPPPPTCLLPSADPLRDRHHPAYSAGKRGEPEPLGGAPAALPAPLAAASSAAASNVVTAASPYGPSAARHRHAARPSTVPSAPQLQSPQRSVVRVLVQPHEGSWARPHPSEDPAAAASASASSLPPHAAPAAAASPAESPSLAPVAPAAAPAAEQHTPGRGTDSAAVTSRPSTARRAAQKRQAHSALPSRHAATIPALTYAGAPALAQPSPLEATLSRGGGTGSSRLDTAKSR